MRSPGPRSWSRWRPSRAWKRLVSSGSTRSPLRLWTGRLDRGRLRGLEEEEALAELRQLPGIGDFFAQGILHRGAGSTDCITRDELSLHAIRTAYDLSDTTPPAQVLEIGERWRPFRMWAMVLLHIDMRRSGALPVQKRPSGPTRFR